MKPRTLLSISLSGFAIWASFVPTAQALDLYWDSDGNTTGATGGGGTWDTSSSLWRNGSSVGALQTYPPANPSTAVAVFGGTAGTVTLSGTPNAAGLKFDVTGYTLTGGTALNLVPSASPFTYTTNGGTNTINSTITSAGGTLISKAGAGTLVLGNGGGGASGNPALYTVTGGTFNSGTGIFSSILSMVAGNRLGNSHPDTTAAAANPMVTLDAGTIQFTQNTENGNNLSNQRGVRVTANGGAINDAGGPGVGTQIPSAIINNAGGTLHLSNISGTTQFQGVISGNGSVMWYGAGTASFQASNTYSGNTNINGGILALGGGSGSVYNFGQNAGTVIVNNGGTLRFDRQDVFGGHTSVPVATISVNSGGLVTGNGFYNTLNNLTLNGGTLQTATGASFWGSFALKGTVMVGGTSVSAISSGGSTDNFVRIGTNTAGGTTTFNVADSTGNGNADLTIAAELRDNREPGSPFNEVASSLTKSGAGTLALYASNNYSGGTSITGGALSIGEVTGGSAIEGSNTGLGSGSVNVSSAAQLIFAGNNLSAGNNITLNGAATVNGLQGALVGGRQDGDSNTTLSGVLTLAGTGDRTVSTWWSDKRLTLAGKITGSGNLRVVNATNGGNGGSIVILSNATNDYSGNTIVDGGGNGSTQTLRLGADNVIPDGAGKGNLFIDGRLELNGFNETVNGISTGGGVISLSSGKTLTIGNNDASGDSFVALTGPGNLTKIGTGTQILRGSSDFSGTTTISGGTLQVSVNGTSASLGSGNIVNNTALAFQRQNDITVGNLISGTGSVSQIGTGTLILSGANTYTGATNVPTGTLRLTGSLSNTPITVAAGATFSPTVTTSAGLSSGSAGASLTLNSGAIFDMTSTNAETINTFTLNPGSNSFSGQALNIAGANLRFDLGSGTADRLQVNSGTAAVTGTNNIRFNTGSSLTPNTYTLIGTTAVSGLAGNFQFDGGSNLSVPAQQQIKNIGGTYYRMTLQNSPTAEQVVVSAAPANIINVMPMGSSITEGATSQPGNTYAGGGYRSQLYQNLVNDGRFTPHFVGTQTVLDAQSNGGYNVLTGANELNHEGHSGWTTSQILKNLNANGGDGGNNGGFWLAPANGRNPDYVTLSIGGNDYAQNNGETTGPLNRTDAIVSQIVSLRPGAHVILSNLFERSSPVGNLQNTHYNPAIPKVVFNHVLAGHHVSFNDAYSAVTPGGSMSHIFDGIHPDTVGYQAFANSWYDVLANGSAFWTGSSGGIWNIQANFALNHQLSTPRQTALSAATDVHFNSNAAPLGTTLGQDISVRSVNFAAGATGAVTIGGPDALTIGAGGITVQAGTGAHTISSNVVLGTDQTWGNVSSNALTVAGSISGSANLSIVGTAVVQLPGTLSGGTFTTTTQTVSGSGIFVLSGANTYSGGTTINGGTLAIGHNTALGSGTVAMNDGSTLANNSAGALTVANAFAFGSTGGMKFAVDNNLTLTDVISGGASGVQINVQGPGTLTLTDTGRSVGSGATPAVWTVNAGGTLALTRGNNLGTLPSAPTAQIILDNGTFSTLTVGGNFFAERGLQVNAAGGTWLDSAGNIEFTGAVLNNGPFTVNTPVSNATSTLSGVVSGSGSLTKSGAGALALSATNTFTGATNVTAGTLLVNGILNAASTVTVSAGTTLGGTGTINSTVTTSGSTSVIAPGSAGIETLDTGNTTLTGVLATELDAATSDLLNVAGDLTVTGATVTFTTLGTPAAVKYVIAKYTGTLTGTLASTTVPTGYQLVHNTSAKEIQLLGSGFANFMEQFSGLSAADKLPGADPDHDGVSNLVEYALDGFNPTTPNAAPGTLTGNVVSFTKRPLAVANNDITYAIEESATLGAAPDPWSVVTPDVNDSNSIAYEMVIDDPAKFVRLKVSQN